MSADVAASAGAAQQVVDLRTLPDRRFEAVVFDWDGTAVPDRAAAAVVARLHACGLAAEVVSSRLNRRKIDLVPEPAWADPPKAHIEALLRAVQRRLRAAGVTGLGEVVALARQEACGAGLADPRVISDAKHVEIGLTDKSDSATWAMGELEREGIGAGLVLVVGDEFGPLGDAEGSDALLLVDAAARAPTASPASGPGPTPSTSTRCCRRPDLAWVLVPPDVHVASDRPIRRVHRADLVVLAWSRRLREGRAPVVREALARSRVPVMLVPVIEAVPRRRLPTPAVTGG